MHTHMHMQVEGNVAKNHLTQIMANLYNQAIQNPLSVQSVELPHGLQVALLVEENIVKLALSRKYQLPSLAEWATVLKYFPYQVSCCPGERRSKERCYLVGAFGKQEQLPMPEDWQ